jgi:ceramide glucosyltransferase
MAIATHLTTWALLFWLATGGAPMGQRMLLAAFGARVLALGVLMLRLREHETLRRFWLLPVKDLAVTAIWIGSWFGRGVEWGGRRFRVEPDGRLVTLPVRSCPAPSLAAPSP